MLTIEFNFNARQIIITYYIFYGSDSLPTVLSSKVDVPVLINCNLLIIWEAWLGVCCSMQKVWWSESRGIRTQHQEDLTNDTSCLTYQHGASPSVPLLVCMHPDRPLWRCQTDFPVSSFYRRVQRADVDVEWCRATLLSPERCQHLRLTDPPDSQTNTTHTYSTVQFSQHQQLQLLL